MLSFTNLMIYLWAKGKVVHKYHPVNAEQTLITSITAQFATECLLQIHVLFTVPQIPSKLITKKTSTFKFYNILI